MLFESFDRMKARVKKAFLESNQAEAPVTQAENATSEDVNTLSTNGKSVKCAAYYKHKAMLQKKIARKRIVHHKGMRG